MLTLLRYFELSFDSCWLCFAWGAWRREQAEVWHGAALFAVFDALATSCHGLATFGLVGYLACCCIALACARRVGAGRGIVLLAALAGFDNLLWGELPTLSATHAAVASFSLAALGFWLGSRFTGVLHGYFSRHAQL